MIVARVAPLGQHSSPSTRACRRLALMWIGRISSSSQFVDAQFHPQPIEVVTRHFIIAAGEFDRVVFERLEPIDDLGATLWGFYGGARRLVSEHRDWLIEQVPIVLVQTIMNNRPALLYGQVQLGGGAGSRVAMHCSSVWTSTRG